MAASPSVEGALQILVKRIREHPGPLGSHNIRLQLHGPGGGLWSLRTAADGVTLVTGEGEGPHTAEVMGDSEAIRAVLECTRDGRDAFLAGGIRVRGDVLAVEQLSAALGTHKRQAAGGSVGG